MISHVEVCTEDSFFLACGLDPILGAQICTDYLVRGADFRSAGFWVAVDGGNRPTAAIGLVDGRMTVSAADPAAGGAVDIAELTEFVRAGGVAVRQLTAPAGVVRRVGLSGHQFTAPYMTYPGGLFGGDYRHITTGFSLGELYDTIIAGFPGYGDVRERWYANTSHLFRHGLGFAAGIREDGAMAATGGVYSMGAHIGVIACVATLPPYRSRGYAGLIVRYLCDRLLEMGRTPALQCAEESLAEYYGAMGFRVCGRWGRIFTGR